MPQQLLRNRRAVGAFAIAVALIGACQRGEGPVEGRAAPLDFTSVFETAGSAVVTIVPIRADGSTVEDDVLGAGFLVDSKGLVVTARHVLQGFSAYGVVFADRSASRLQLVLTDEKTDLAVVRTEIASPKGAVPLAWVEGQAAPRVGSWVATIGAPFGLERSLTTGIVSATGRSAKKARLQIAGLEERTDLIQTDAVLHPGNSGGPLLDSGGRVLGLVVASFGVTQRIGFAVPAAALMPLVGAARQKSAR